MASGSKKNSAVGAQKTFCSEGGICQHGFLIKSPPLQLLNSQKSWKRRFFILSKSSKGNYILKYLKGQSVKGSIPVDEIVKVEIGISSSEIMATVKKMFRCFLEEVMSITTGNRCYYLIGKSSLEIEDWVTAISSVMKAKIDGHCPQNQNLANPEVKSRPWSLPLFLDSEDVTSSLERQSYLEGKTLRKSDENSLSSDSDEDIKKEVEAYYETPSNLLAKCITEVSKPEPTAVSHVPVPPKKTWERKPVKENVYVSMESLRLLDKSCQLTCGCDRPPTPPKRWASSTCPRDLEANRDPKLPESSTTQQFTLKGRHSSSPLSVVQLSVLLSQVTDETQLQVLDIFIPLADINSYLQLTEAVGQICVSQWTGPCHLGCLFNHGDRIVAVNDLHPQNLEEASLFISRSIRKEVKLTVCRIPHSDTFHVKGCSCS
ncbi:pleckstrin homology domain-containing family S member 1 isoform X3 [Anas platyrhynchos]|uniref:pleckstrin homology domain-containing family S member 1 isoform X3 n=1 Tax=Anas platyrhynchos TaxID=8839 RepID=UPI0003512052|nr:pleckstrin homology domain-containing family S member 1 isoform X3 [Anas platyrhynchos]|eukprot:XP_012950142.1 pleckstrin homology domain-containing family S member 1 isoform X3 [Anas platyrhynchos]